MDYAIYFLLIGFVVEIGLYVRKDFLMNKLFVTVVAVFVSLSFISLLFSNLGLWLFLAIFFNTYRLVNIGRIYIQRSHIYHLYNAGRQTSLALIACILIVVANNSISNRLVIDAHSWLYVICSAQLFAAIVIYFIARRNLDGVRKPNECPDVATRNLPSITVAIPARNETEDLQKCLDSLLLSDYPKLEILVLDDSSQTKRTPEIIRGYAHNGVRFLAGKEPPHNWLPKNYAYKQLADASSGQFLLFCGVDVRFDRFTISNIVKMMIHKNVDMLGLIPENISPIGSKLLSFIYQPSRYAWELALPRNVTFRPPALSTCWIINKDALNAAGGFESFAQSVLPERVLARFCVNNFNGYAFEATDQKTSLKSNKTLAEQYSTALRTRYPSLHRRPELVSLITLAEFTVLTAPYLLLIYAAISTSWILILMTLLSVVLQSITFASMINLTYRKNMISGIFVLPLASIWDIYILNKSMVQYEFGSVYWKNRNIAIPVMHRYK